MSTGETISQPGELTGFNLNLLYHNHQGAAEAEAALTFIQSDSIVFVEGHMLDPEYAKERVSAMMRIAADRLNIGQYDDDLKQDFLELANNFLTRDKTPHDLHDDHNYSEFKGLLDKNCVVLPADFLNIDDADLSEFSSWLERTKIEVSSERSSLWQAVQYARKRRQIFDSFLAFNEFRELHAVNAIAKSLQDLDIAPTSKIYVLYGAAHRITLTKKLERAGASVEVLVLGDYDKKQGSDLIAWSMVSRKEFRHQEVVEYLINLLASSVAEEKFEQAAELRDLIADIVKRM